MEENNTNTNEGKKLSPMVIGIIVVALLLVAGGIFLANQNSSAPQSTTNPNFRGEIDPNDPNVPPADNSQPQGTDSAMMEDGSMMDDSEVTVVEVEGGSFYFEPNEIRVNEGDTVRIVLNSVDAMHDFVIDEFDAATQVAQAGESVEVSFTADTAGEYEFHCSVGNHREQGMVGTLIVE